MRTYAFEGALLLDSLKVIQKLVEIFLQMKTTIMTRADSLLKII
jgi:hypothetical protein